MTRSNIFSLDDPSNRLTPLLATLFSTEFGFPPGFRQEVHPHDEMLRYSIESHNGDLDRGKAAYFYSGIRAFQMTQQLIEWRFDSSDALDMLDFASGYGRVTRFLLERLGPQHLTISDVMSSAVEYQRTVFDVNAVVSSTHPGDFTLSDSYHIVQAISLFSHLSEASFRRWLSRLWECVKPGGLLIFTVHDVSLSSHSEGRKDFIFSPASENQGLDPSDYGTTWVSESFVRRTLHKEISGYSCMRLPRGLNGHQDVYVVVKEERVDFSSLEYRSGAEGFVESANPRVDGGFSCSGWAASIDRSIDRKSSRESISSSTAGWSRRAATSRDDLMSPLTIVTTDWWTPAGSWLSRCPTGSRTATTW
jgi:SAM-dependent methyltransferase